MEGICVSLSYASLVFRLPTPTPRIHLCLGLRQHTPYFHSAS